MPGLRPLDGTGVSAATTFDGSSAEMTMERVMRAMCRASAVTEVTSQDGWFASECAAVCLLAAAI